MPQLMPLFWNFSVFIIFLFVLMMILVFGDYFIKFFNKKEIMIEKKIMNKWFW